MFKRLYPSEDADNIYEIDFEDFYLNGYRAVLFDIDNTLVEHGAPATPKVIDFFKRLHELGFETCLISNNKEPRVAPFAGQVKSPYIFKGGKPSVKGYERAMEVMGTGRENTLFIGDQLFTDVWGARRTGLYSILTKPMDPHEEIQIVFKRYLEAVVLRAYKKQRQKPDV